MELKLGKTYLLLIDVSGRDLTFVAKILDNDGAFVTFIDKNNKKLTYRIDRIVSCEEIMR